MSSFDLNEFFDAAFKRSYGENANYVKDPSHSAYTGKKNYKSRYPYSRRKSYSNITNSVINSAMHGGGLYEAFDITPATNAVRRAAAMRARDLDNKYKYSPEKTPGLHKYMEDIGFGARHYILSKPAQTAIARAASADAARDNHKHPYAYYVKKHQGFV